MFFKTLVSFALCVTVAQSKWSLFRRNQAPVAPKSETNRQPQGDDRRVAIIFVSKTSGARFGEQLLREYAEKTQEFNEKQLYLYDIQDQEKKNAGLVKACEALQGNGDSELIVAAAGGDGTVSWVVSLLGEYKETNRAKCFVSPDLSEAKELNPRIFIRHIGFGTGNDFAKSSGYTNEFDLLGEYKKTEPTWFGTLKNLNVWQDVVPVRHTMWEVNITATSATSVSRKGKVPVHSGTATFVDDSTTLVTEKALLYVSGPFSGLMPCKVEQHRAKGGKLISGAIKNKLSYGKYGVKAFFKKSPPLKKYLGVNVVHETESDAQEISFPDRSQEFLLLLGKTFGGGKTPSTSKTLGDSKIEVLAAGGMLDLATMKFKKLGYAKRRLDMTFDHNAWEQDAQGFASKIENKGKENKKQVYTIQKDGECRRLEDLASISMAPDIRFNVLTYTK